MALFFVQHTKPDWTVGRRSKQVSREIKRKEAKTTSHQRSPDSDTNNKGNRGHDMTGGGDCGMDGWMDGGVVVVEVEVVMEARKRKKEPAVATHRREPSLDLTESGRFAS